MSTQHYDEVIESLEDVEFTLGNIIREKISLYHQQAIHNGLQGEISMQEDDLSNAQWWFRQAYEASREATTLCDSYVGLINTPDVEELHEVCDYFARLCGQHPPVLIPIIRITE